MIISSLVAMNRSLLIGKDNDLTWHLKDDLTHFKNYSMNKPIVMGEILMNQLEDHCRTDTIL